MSIALILAILSAILVPPSAGYIDYINYRVLALLFCLMTIVAGMVRVGAFDVMSHALLSRIKTLRGMNLLLVVLSFVLSMFLTNDVTLITVVPFTMMLLTMTGTEHQTIFLLILETLAANLGSMFTPFGNPQNLYLYTEYELSIGYFLQLMLPYTALSLLLLVVQICVKPNRTLEVNLKDVGRIRDRKALGIYLILFALSILTVARLVDYRFLLALTVAIVLVMDRKLFHHVDYSLLLTFIFFFIFVGNMGKIPAVSSWIGSIVEGRVFPVSILASQVISNVPAALLLSGFTSDYESLILGTDLGGLGTLIASMASLISYKFYAETHNDTKGRYLLQFTLWNIVYLIALCLLYVLLHML